MANTLKKSASNLQKLAGVTAKQEPVEQQEERITEDTPKKKTRPQDEVLIGASFPRIVRRSISLLMADPRNDGKTIKDLLAEALNDLFYKYGLPETAKIDIDRKNGLDSQ